MNYRVSVPGYNKHLRWVLLTSAIVAIAGIPVAGHAQAAGAGKQARAHEVQFNVPSQDLDSALTSIADQGGIHIFFTSGELAGRRTNGLSGRMTVEQALSRALTGSGFGWRYREAGTVIIEKLPEAQGAITLGPVRVQGTDDENRQTGVGVEQQSAEEYRKGSYKVDHASSTKYTAPLLDTPQTVQIVSKRVFNEQGATTLSEALANVAGVGNSYTGADRDTTTGDTIYMRGFDASGSIFVDGVRDLGQLSRDTFNIDQVEVLKGPAGTDTGRSVAAGGINVSSKQARLDTFADITVTGSTENQKRVTADLNYRFSRTGAFRLNAMAQDSDRPGRDIVKDKRWAIAPSLALGLGTGTRFYLNYLYLKQNNIPDSGVSTLNLYLESTGVTPVNKIESSNYYGTIHDFDDGSVNMATAKIEHDFSPNVTLRNISRWGRTKEVAVFTTYSTVCSGTDTTTCSTATTDNAANWVRRSESGAPTIRNQVNEILTNQTSLSAKFGTGPFIHSLNAGFELIREKQTNLTGTATSFPASTNLYDPDPYAAAYTYSYTDPTSKGKTDTISAYLFDSIALGEHWQANAGLRLDHYKTTYDTNYSAGKTCNATGTKGAIACPPGVAVGTTVYDIFIKQSDTLINWKLGLVYKPRPNGSIYVNYAISQQPPGGKDFALSNSASSSGYTGYEPEKAKTFEIGTKWDLLDKRLGLTAAFYHTEVDNDVEADPDAASGDSQYGQKRVQGVELGATGQITPAWQVSAGFAITDTKITEGAAATADSSSGLPYNAKYSFTSWSTYKLPFGLTIGGGARYRSKLTRESAGTSNPVPNTVADYWVFDALVQYEISPSADVRLNVYNLFDKDYAVSLSRNGTRYIPGAPRYAALTLNMHF